MAWFVGILCIVIGIFMVVKTRWIYDFTGPIEWAEAHLGSGGGTLLLIKLLGVVLIIGTLLAATGVLGNMVRGMFGSSLQL